MCYYLHTVTCRQNDWCRATHPQTHNVRHGVPEYSQSCVNSCHLERRYVLCSIRLWLLVLYLADRHSECRLAKTFVMFLLQALHGRLVQALPFSFGSLRFASSFKVMRKRLTYSFSPGEACITPIPPDLPSGVPVHIWCFVSGHRTFLVHYEKKEVIFYSLTPTCTSYLEFKVSFPLCLSLTVCLLWLFN